jgi:hypothetical protein
LFKLIFHIEDFGISNQKPASGWVAWMTLAAEYTSGLPLRCANSYLCLGRFHIIIHFGTWSIFRKIEGLRKKQRVRDSVCIRFAHTSSGQRPGNWACRSSICKPYEPEWPLGVLEI